MSSYSSFDDLESIFERIRDEAASRTSGIRPSLSQEASSAQNISSVTFSDVNVAVCSACSACSATSASAASATNVASHSSSSQIDEPVRMFIYFIVFMFIFFIMAPLS